MGVKNWVLIGVIAFLCGLMALLLRSSPIPRGWSVNDKFDFLLHQFPLSAPITLSTGVKVPTPFHSFDFDANIIMGRANHAAVAKHVAERASPDIVVSKTTDGYALVLVYLVEYRATAIGAYKEAIYTAVIGPDTLRCASTSPTCGSAAILTKEDPAITFNVKLWLNESVPVDYGRDILGTDKELISSGFRIDFNDGVFSANVPGVVEATVHAAELDASGQMSAAASLFSTVVRFSDAIGALLGPFVDLTSYNPRGFAKGVPPEINPIMYARLINQDNFIVPWSPEKSDTYKPIHPLLKEAQLEPQLIQRWIHARMAVTSAL